MTSIPEEITGIKQWSYSYSTEELKRPAHADYKPNGAMDYMEAKTIASISNPNRLIGFYVTEEDPYILGDLDKIKDPNNPFEELPSELAYLLKSKETYFEISPSGKGIRFILKFISLEEKKQIQGSVFYTKELTDPKEKKSIQINLGSPWMTITGNPTDFSSSRIALVSTTELSRCYDLKLERKKDKTVTLTQLESTIKVPFSKLKSAIMSLPLDQNPRIQRAYEKTFNCGYEHYDYWLKVLMGLKYYSELAGNSMDCLSLITSWSAQDEQSYTGEEDVARHWDSLNKIENEDDPVTHLSILKLTYNNTLLWPIPKEQSKTEQDLNMPLKPLTTEYVNFKALVEYFNIKVYGNYLEEHTYFLTGDSDILDQNFKMLKVELHYEKYYGPISQKTLIPMFHIFLQDNGFLGIGHNRVQEFLRNWVVDLQGEINLMRLYFDTPFYELPISYQDNAINYNTSTFDKLFECLKIDFKTKDEEKELALYKRYYKCWLMGLVRGLYYEGQYKENNCILLLTGIEQIRKTSHFKALLPNFLRGYITNTSHDFSTSTSIRDIAKLATDNLIIVWDELEKYLTTTTESLFKNMIDNKPTKVIDKWEVSASTFIPRAIYGATSNQSTFRIGTKGSRRLFHIPVTWVDTDTMNELCWHPIISEIKEEMFEGLKKKGHLPWLLTKEELQYQASLHENIRFKSELEAILWEVYKFEKEFVITSKGEIKNVTTFRNDRSGTLKTIRQVIADLSTYGMNTYGVRHTELRKALEAACSAYTNTQRYHSIISNPKCIIIKGAAWQGDRHLWVMPELRNTEMGYANEDAEEAFKDFT